MGQLTLLATSQEYFSEVLEDNFLKRKMKVAPSVKSYLVSMLEFYLDARNLYDEPTKESGERNPQTLAELYLTAQNSENQMRQELLRKLGDRSLYISGFFADSLNRKIIDLDYYVRMGSSAYHILGEEQSDDHKAFVYRNIATQFVDFVDVLNLMSEAAFYNKNSSLLRVYEKFVRTGSNLAKEKLIEAGIFPANIDDPKKLQKIS